MLRGDFVRKIKIRRRHSVLKRLLIAVAFLLLLGVCIYGVFEHRLSIVISQISANTVKSKAAIIISDAIYEEIAENDITYDKLVSFEKDTSGRITALKTNIIEINRLKSRLAVRVLDELDKMDTAELQIPLGTVIGGDLMVGKGPGIKVNVMPVGSIETEIVNEISSAGINQSRHQIMLKMTAKMTIITSVTKLATEVKTYICIAETVIVGDVPRSYTNIGTTDGYFAINRD